MEAHVLARAYHAAWHWQHGGEPTGIHVIPPLDWYIEYRPNGKEETLRWPTNLDRDAIVRRLVQIRELSQARGVQEVASLFANVEDMPPARIGANVIVALSWLLNKPEHVLIATKLEMVAVNLKNLK